MATEAWLGVWYLPRPWIEDQQRAQEVRLPKGLTYRSQAELALELIDQMLSWEMPQLPVVADSAYGNSFEFREQLRQRHLAYVMAVEPQTVVWIEDPNAVPVPPSAPRGRPRRYLPLESTPTPQDLTTVARQLPESAWKKMTWRAGSRGPQRSRTAAYVPLPLRVIFWGVFGALSFRVAAPVRVPAAVGVNLTLIVQLAPAATVLPQLPSPAK
jgi:SRSO17 transposase